MCKNMLFIFKRNIASVWLSRREGIRLRRRPFTRREGTHARITSPHCGLRPCAGLPIWYPYGIHSQWGKTEFPIKVSKRPYSNNPRLNAVQSGAEGGIIAPAAVRDSLATKNRAHSPRNRVSAIDAKQSAESRKHSLLIIVPIPYHRIPSTLCTCSERRQPGFCMTASTQASMLALRFTESSL